MDSPSSEFASVLPTPADARRFRFIVFFAGVLAGLLSWPLLLWAHERFPVPAIPDSMVSLPDDSPEVRSAMRSAQQTADFRNAALGFGLLGAALGGMLGGGAALRSALAAARGIVAGILIGGVLGACSGLARVFVQSQLDRTHLDLTVRSTLSYAVGLALIGLGAGLAVGLARLSRSAAARCGLAGAFGGLIAGALYPFLTAVVFPLEHANQPLPTGTLNPLLFAGLVSLLIGAAVGRALDQSPASASG